ncbi:hypothetical protein HU200_011954 [Digitaria exilis]|uniref:Core Histone H2A/H2B/H3 domain-containing protein n=1 Tax=Digitaria exilis TaxID=1010633 RepID=A0A835FGA2_9POAL|nr:hypothetical protein HU200_011954 [Digitaria exilis]
MVLRETVEVTTAIVTDGEPAEQRLAPGAPVAPPTVDVSSFKVVHVVEVTTPDGGGSKQAAANAKRSRVGGRREEEKHVAPPVMQSQQTQDPNEQQPETLRVASERKTSTTATKTKPQQQKENTNKTKRKAGQRRRRRRLGEVSRGGDAAMGWVGGYKRYVWRLLKQVHPELGVSGNAMRVLDTMMADMFEWLAGEATRLATAATTRRTRGRG